jgi:hypothetical protein
MCTQHDGPPGTIGTGEPSSSLTGCPCVIPVGWGGPSLFPSSSLPPSAICSLSRDACSGPARTESSPARAGVYLAAVTGSRPAPPARTRTGIIQNLSFACASMRIRTLRSCLFGSRGCRSYCFAGSYTGRNHAYSQDSLDH